MSDEKCSCCGGSGCSPDESSGEPVVIEVSFATVLSDEEIDKDAVIDSLKETRLRTLTLAQLASFGGEDLTNAALDLQEYFQEVEIDYPIPSAVYFESERNADILEVTNGLIALIDEALPRITEENFMEIIYELQSLNTLWRTLVSLLANELNSAHENQKTALGNRFDAALDHPKHYTGEDDSL